MPNNVTHSTEGAQSFFPKNLATLLKVYVDQADTATDPSLKAILKRIKAIQSITDTVYTILPESMKNGFCSASLTGGVLCLIANQSRIARAFRYEKAYLQSRLRALNLEFDQLRVLVQLDAKVYK